MKKYLLLIISMVCAVTGAWGGSTLSGSGENWTITIHAGDAADLSDISPAFSHQASENCVIKVITESGASINAAGISAIANGILWNYQAIKQLDLSDATISGDLSTASFNGNDNYSHVNSLIMPKDGTLPAESLMIGGGALNSGGNPALYYVIVPNSDGSEITLYIPAISINNSDVKCDIDILSGETYLTNATFVNLQFTSNVASETRTTFENYIFGSESGQLNKQHAFDGVVTNVTGGSVQSNVETALDGKAASKVKSLTITSGTLTTADVTYITGTLTGMTALDLSGATLSVSQLIDILEGSSASVTVNSANITGWADATGEYITAAMQEKLTGLTASDFVANLTNATPNYVVDGSALVVTGTIAAGDLTTIKGKLDDNSSLTTLDVSNCTNSSGNVNITDSNLSTNVATVSLPGNEYITYNGTQATALENGALTIAIGNGSGEYASISSALSDTNLSALLNSGDVKHVVVTGELSAADLGDVHNIGNTYTGKVESIDLSGITKASAAEWSSITGSFGNANVLLPQGTGITTLTDGNLFTVNNNVLTAKEVVTSTFADGVEYFSQKKNASIVVANLSGTSASTLLALSPVTAVLSESNGRITPTGEVTSDVLSAMNSITSATSFDFSEATFASGLSINDLTIPSSLTSLVLPNSFTTISDALRSKFAAASNLKYAYSPTSQNQTKAEQTTSPDLVWVNQPGGLNQAMINETKLMTGIYVKVESSVALNADDVNLSTNNDGVTNHAINDADATNWPWQFIDFSGANLQQDVCLSYTKPHSKAYRIIMPDGWSGDQLAIIASLGSDKYGSLAAVYSYTSQGFLQILETDDYNYNPTALGDGRIVRNGTKAIRVVSGTYGGQTYGTFGDYNDGSKNHLLEAINDAASSIEAVTITNTRTVQSSISIDNDNLIYIQIEGIHNANNSSEGPALNVDDCAKLGTLNLINSVFASVDASVPATAADGNTPATTGLTTVNMTGTTVTGNADFSNSPITTFTTNGGDNGTWIMGNLDLTRTALTSFANSLKVGTANTANTGDIILNETPLNSLALNQVVFNYDSSKIIVRKSKDSGSSDYSVLTGSLSSSNKIVVPAGFGGNDAPKRLEDRIVPWISGTVEEQTYVAPAWAFSSTDMRLHTANQNNDGDNYVYWYTGDAQANKVLTITMTDDRRGKLSTILGSGEGNANITSSIELVKVKITGPLASDDLDALNVLNTQILDLSEATLQKETSETYENDNTILGSSSAINSYVKFLLLPTSMIATENFYNTTTKKFSIDYSALETSFPGLYSAIALTDYNTSNAFDFVAYNKVAGTLQPATIAAGRGTLNGSQMIRGEEGNTRTAYYPVMSGNYDRSATIAGKINAYDLSYNAKLDADGHLAFDKRYANESLDADDRTNVGTETKIQGAFSGSNGPRTLDLKAAEITGPEYINDICISYLVPTNYLKYLIIPETESVKETPSYFITHNTVKEICIPSNIEVIRTHFAPSVDHIWTNAASGDITGTKYDNGAFSAKSEEDAPTEANYGYTDFTFSGLMPYGTYTFSSNLKMIESHAFANTQPHVKDVYVLATTAPECHVDAFCTAMYVGNSGFSPNVTGGVITRDSYVNGTNWITMLHYPRQCISPEVQRYTDPTRSYNIASNEIDGKGGVLYYPSYGEFLAAYAQGTTGYLWNAFDRTYEFGMLKNSLSIENTGWTLANQRSANSKFLKNPDLIADNTNTKWTCTSFYDVTAGGTETQPTNLAYYYKVRWDERNLYDGGSKGIQLYPQAESANDIDGDGNITAKDYRGWHQFVLNAYAANTDIPVVPSRSYVTDSDWWTICLPYDLTYNETMLFFGTANDDGTVASDKVPYVCLLSNVVRDHVNNHITLNFSSNLMNHKASKSENGIWSIDANNAPNHDIAKDIEHGGTADIVIHAGVPYLIKPVFPANAKRQFDIYGPTGVVDAALSSGRITATDTQYPGLYDKLHAAQDIAGSTFLSMLQDNLYTVPALLPKDTYDPSKEAYVDDTEYTYLDKTYYRSNAYDYTFVGSFMKNVIPPYCYFLGVKGGKAAFIYADYLDLDGNDPVKAAKKYKYMNTMMWNNNSGVICPNMFASTSDKHFYRLAHTGGHDGEIEVASGSGENMKPARWEIFTTTNNTMNNMLPKDDFSSKSPAPAMLFGFDLPQGTTGIDNNMTTSISFEDENVYSLNGRFVGTTLEGLAKGVYIRNGKKIVVK